MAIPKPLQTTPATDSDAVQSALRTLEAEGSGIAALAAALESDLAPAFAAAGELIRTSTGRLIITGLGVFMTSLDTLVVTTALPALRAASDYYFRAEVEGLENIPSDEPVLLVGNHSGGTMIADTFVFAQHFCDFFGPQRLFHQLAHDLVFQVPGVRASLSRFGTVPANPDNMRRALERGAALLVYPGGDQETYRPTWEQDRIDFAGRTGFAKLSLELDTPIVPVVAIGGQETALFLSRGEGLSKLLGLDRLLRL